MSYKSVNPNNHLFTILKLGIIPFALIGCNRSQDKSKLNKITNNLYEITYTNDFDWKQAKTSSVFGFGCSGIQNGQYRGRNYDWEYKDTDICIVHSTVTNNRPHASVGVVD